MLQQFQSIQRKSLAATTPTQIPQATLHRTPQNRLPEAEIKSRRNSRNLPSVHLANLRSERPREFLRDRRGLELERGAASARLSWRRRDARTSASLMQPRSIAQSRRRVCVPSVRAGFVGDFEVSRSFVPLRARENCDGELS